MEAHSNPHSMHTLKIDDGVKMMAFILLISQFFFLNGIFLFLSMLVFYIGFYYLQHPYKPAVFTIIFFYHFLQIIGGVWQATYLDRDLDFRSPNMTLATIMSLLGLLIMFAPIIYYQYKIPPMSIEILKKHANRLSLNKTFYAYVVYFFISNSLNEVRFLLPGYTQVIISIVNLKWFLFLLFGIQAVLKKQRKREFYFFILLEFIIGFYSFFSDFKTVIFFVIVLYMMMFRVFSSKRFFIGLGGFIIIFLGATIWTTIKVEYRRFLNKGSASQNVEVSQNEALSKLYEISNLQGRQITSSATEKFLDRLQGTYHLAKTMDMVPAVIPYQFGNNWGETFTYVFTPRLLNPDKEQLNSSEKATKYTGIKYAGREQGSAFSLGYFADCYIDFGIVGMFVLLFLIGLLFGYSYYYFVRSSSHNFVFNFAVVCALYMRFFAFEMDSVFFIGSLVTDLLTYTLMSMFLFPWLYRFLQAPPTDNPA